MMFWRFFETGAYPFGHIPAGSLGSLGSGLSWLVRGGWHFIILWLVRCNVNAHYEILARFRENQGLICSTYDNPDAIVRSSRALDVFKLSHLK